MMKFRLYIIVLISCHIFLNCNEGTNEPASPDIETEVYYGDIYIACDNSPQYRFSLDSLIVNCNATDTSDFSFPMGIQTTMSTCLYDGNFGLATIQCLSGWLFARYGCVAIGAGFMNK